MASEIRVNRLSNRSGLSTITFANGGVQFSGITTFANGEFYVGTGATIINPGTNEFNFHTGGSNRFTINNSGANLGTGNITAVDATFSGNVSIGKTLTYEDVKNVDSVGVVTARTGVKVTGGDLTVGTAITASSVTGNVTQDVGITTFSGSATWFKGTTANKDMYWSKSSGSLIFKDTAAALFGDGSDLQIYHSSNVNHIKGSNSRNIYIQADDVAILNEAGNQTGLWANAGGSLDLFYANSKKLETTNLGVRVVGDLQMGNTAGVRFHHTGTTSIFETQTAGDDLIFKTTPSGGSTTERFRIKTSNDVVVFTGSNSATLTFRNDTSNEMQIHTGGSDALILGTGGENERVRIDSSGVFTLKQSSTNTTSSNWNGAAIGIQNTSDTDNNASVIWFRNSAGGSDCAIQGIHQDAAGTGGSRRGHIQFGTAGSNSSGSVTERVRITENGIVNIGGDYAQTAYQAQVTGDLLLQKTQSAYQHPQLELYNYVNAGYAGAIKFSGKIGGSKYQQALIKAYGGSNTTDGALAFCTGNGNDKVKIESSGNVLIGGSSFDTGNFGSVQGLNVYGTQPLVLVNATGNGTSFFMGKTSSACYFGTSDAQAINFRVSDSDKMQLDANGNLLLGTTTATSEFTVRGGGTVAAFEGTGGSVSLMLKDVDDNSLAYALVDGGNFDIQTSNISYATKLRVTPHGRIVICPDGSTAGSAYWALSVVNTGNFSSSGIYPGIWMKSNSAGASSGSYIWTTDDNWGLKTNASQAGLAFAPNGSGASSADCKLYIGSDGIITCGPETFNKIAHRKSSNTALGVAGGALSVGPKGNTTATNEPGRYVLGWYMVSHYASGYHHIKTDMWAGGSPHGNNEWIMGGFHIHGYRYNSSGISEEIIYFHNWSGGYANLDIEHWGSWNPSSTVYTSSDGYVTLRLAAGTYYGYVIDYIQHAWYTNRTTMVTSYTNSGNATI